MARVLLVTGPAGSGKSTTSESFASTRRATTARLDMDLIRSFVRAGFVDPSRSWGPEAERQWELGRAICVAAIDRYRAAGIDCVQIGRAHV